MIDRDKNFPLIYSLITVRNSVTVSETVRAHVGCPKIWEGRSRGSAALDGVADPKQTEKHVLPTWVNYHANYGRFRSNGT